MNVIFSQYTFIAYFKFIYSSLLFEVKLAIMSNEGHDTNLEDTHTQTQKDTRSNKRINNKPKFQWILK